MIREIVDSLMESVPLTRPATKEAFLKAISKDGAVAITGIQGPGSMFYVFDLGILWKAGASRSSTDFKFSLKQISRNHPEPRTIEDLKKAREFFNQYDIDVNSDGDYVALTDHVYYVFRNGGDRGKEFYKADELDDLISFIQGALGESLIFSGIEEVV